MAFMDQPTQDRREGFDMLRVLPGVQVHHQEWPTRQDDA